MALTLCLQGLASFFSSVRRVLVASTHRRPHYEPFVPMLSWLRVRIVTFHRHQIASSVIIHLLPSLAPLGYGFSVPLHGLSIGCGYRRKAFARPLPIFFQLLDGSSLATYLRKVRDSNSRIHTDFVLSRDAPSTTRPTFQFSLFSRTAAGSVLTSLRTYSLCFSAEKPKHEMFVKTPKYQCKKIIFSRFFLGSSPYLPDSSMKHPIPLPTLPLSYISPSSYAA